MRASTLEMMHDHVRSIHRAVTGDDPPEPQPIGDRELPTLDVVARRFAELETLAYANRFISERVPSFSFAPPVDVLATERELIVELGVPGVEAADVDAEAAERTLIVSGARSTRQVLEGRIYFHTEMARGPFRRVIPLPEAASGTPRVEVENGVIRVRLSRVTKASVPQA